MTSKEKLRLECLRLATVQGTGAAFTVATARAYEEYIVGVHPSKRKPELARSVPTYAGHQP